MGFHHGLSGLNAASKSLDVIGHNIANSNTTGFKSSRAEFSAMVANAMGGCGCGGTGIGVSVAAVSQQFSQGVITPTSNGLDMAINGNGFFRIETSSGNVAYTRSGNFQLKELANSTTGTKDTTLVTVTGDKVTGYPVDPLTGNINGAVGAITFPSGGIAAKQTDTITAKLNLDARTAEGPDPQLRLQNGTSLQVFDSLGVAQPVSIYFEKDAGGTPGTGNVWSVYDSLDATATAIGTITFNTDGSFASATPATLALTVTASNGAAVGAAPPTFDVNLDLSEITQFGNAFSVTKLTQNGYASGELSGVNVSEDGTLMASYTNGVTRPEARLALATFANAQGLVPSGDNYWMASADSGEAMVNPAGAGSTGSIIGSALEDSNVDLTAELVNMMTAQRFYQANAQTIKTQDQVFSTLTNLR